jgi:hypothetical protein
MLWVRDKRASDGTWTIGEWNHFVVNITNKNNKMTVNIWINGENKYNYTSSTYAINLCAGTISLTGTAAIQDFKLYDSPLSQTEIERDYCSLLLHYPLRDAHIENTKNLALYPTPSGTASASWDSNLHSAAIKVANWSLGYNGGVSTPGTGYHACWELIDNIPTMVMRDYNTDYSLGHRWLGISSNQNSNNNLISQITPGGKYTISFEARTDINGKSVSAGLYYKIAGASSASFHEGTKAFALTPSWTRYSFTHTLSSSADSSTHTGQIYIYGHNDSSKNGTIYVRNIQLEINDHSTAYVKSERLNEQIYDCSGRGNHSISRGDLLVSKDTLRNTNSIEFTANNAIKIPSPYGTSTVAMDKFSIAFWVKLKDNASAYRTIFVTNYGNNTGNGSGWLSLNTEGKGLWFYTNSTYFGAGAPLAANTWYHVVLTFDKGVATWYLNGKLYGSVTSTTTTSINANPYFGLGDSYTGSSWSGASFNGNICDFRLYGVAIPASVVSDLYANSATIDKEGNLHAYEFMEV